MAIRPEGGDRDAEASARAAVEAQIEAELVRHVLAQAPIGFAIGTLAVGAITVVLWDAAPRTMLLAWLVAIGLLTLPAAVVWRRARAADVAEAAQRWDRMLTIAYGLAGAGWGMAAFLVYPWLDLPFRAFLLLVLGGAGVSGVAALAPVRSAFVAYLTATFVPIVVVLVDTWSTAAIASALLLVAFWVSTVSLASRLRELLIRSLRLHFENLDNLGNLTRARDVLQGALSSTTRDVADLASELAIANRAKDEFLAIVSHELRTPLTPILTWATMLRTRYVDAATSARGLETIERNAKLQSRIVGDLLDVSRAITGKLTLDLGTMVLDPVIRTALEALRPAAEAKGIRLVASLAADRCWIAGDAERLQQVVWNLVSNAVKFTPRGGVVEVRSGSVDGGVVFVVRDDGVGIGADALPHLFERFWQSDTSITRAHGGLGLGLAVVRHLVELHRGTVTAESEGVGRGATFTVRLPATAAVHAPAVAAAPRVGASERLRGVRLLVVDDDPDTCDTLGTVLEAEGAVVRTCLSAAEALDVLEQWVPDIMLSDIAMPGEDGYALMRRIRAREADEGGNVLAIALTAYGSDEDRRRALSAGFEVHVGKPVAPDHLIGIVAGIVEDRVGTRH